MFFYTRFKGLSNFCVNCGFCIYQFKDSKPCILKCPFCNFFCKNNAGDQQTAAATKWYRVLKYSSCSDQLEYEKPQYYLCHEVYLKNHNSHQYVLLHQYQATHLHLHRYCLYNLSKKLKLFICMFICHSNGVRRNMITL